MATTPTQIRIDKTVKEEANSIFAQLGLDMSSAVNIFLRQCILRGGLPFSVELPKNDAKLENDTYKNLQDTLSDEEKLLLQKNFANIN